MTQRDFQHASIGAVRCRARRAKFQPAVSCPVFCHAARGLLYASAGVCHADWRAAARLHHPTLRWASRPQVVSGDRLAVSDCCRVQAGLPHPRTGTTRSRLSDMHGCAQALVIMQPAPQLPAARTPGQLRQASKQRGSFRSVPIPSLHAGITAESRRPVPLHRTSVTGRSSIHSCGVAVSFLNCTTARHFVTHSFTPHFVSHSFTPHFVSHSLTPHFVNTICMAHSRDTPSDTLLPARCWWRRSWGWPRTDAQLQPHNPSH
jgi:hypothetical protein